MPELPEIEVIKRGLKSSIIGKKILKIKINNSKSFIGCPEDLLNKEILEINRYGKLLEFKLKSNFSFLIHLKMTGQLIYQNSDQKAKIVGGHPQKSYNQPLPHKHTHIIFEFKDGSKIYFNDLRKFGYCKVILSNKLTTLPFIKKLGVDALAQDFKYSYLITKIEKKPNTTVYKLLLDQTVVGGLGNIYVNEALYLAGILPTRKNHTLANDEIKLLIKKIKTVLNKSIAMGGSSDSTFRSIEGNAGLFLKNATVYRKKRDPKNHILKRLKINGRTAHFCEICQK